MDKNSMGVTLKIDAIVAAFETRCPNIAIDMEKSLENTNSQRAAVFFTLLGQEFCALLHPYGPRLSNGEPATFLSTTFVNSPLSVSMLKGQSLDWKQIDGFSRNRDGAVRHGAPDDIAAGVIQAAMSSQIRQAA